MPRSPETPTGGDGAQVGNLDMSDDRDRRLIRTAARRWGVDEDFKTQAVKALKMALRMAIEKEDHRGINGCVKTLAQLESQNQADEHLDVKYQRIDRGLPTEVVSLGAILDDPELAERAYELLDSADLLPDLDEALRDRSE